MNTCPTCGDVLHRDDGCPTCALASRVLPKRPALLAVRHALGLHEAFRRLGVPSSCIYVAPRPDGALGVFAVPLKPDTFAPAWRDAVRWWNEAPHADRDALYAEFRDHFTGAVQFVALVQSRTWAEPS